MPDDNNLYWNNANDDDDAYDDYGDFDGGYDASDDYAADDVNRNFYADDAASPGPEAAGFPDDDDVADDDFFEVRTFDISTDDVDLRPPARRTPDPEPAPRDAASRDATAQDDPPPRARPRVQPPAGPPVPAFSTPLHHGATVMPRPAAVRPRRPAPVWWVTLRTLVIVILAATIVSTIFSLWTRPDFFTDEFRAGLNQVQATQRVINIQPSPLPTESRTVRIGIIAGHSGPPQDASFESDPGAVCPDGLTELSINEAVAREVVSGLQRLEYDVDLLEEFDDQLDGYQANVLVSLHTNDCQDYGAAGTGFNAASASARQTTRGEDEFLLDCLINSYSSTTGLPHHEGLTYDMTGYHTFGEVSSDTPTAIVELGFMNHDRLMLTTQQSVLAEGIINGILCFLEPEDATNPS